MEAQSVMPEHRSSRWIDLITEQEYESCLQSDMEVDMDENRAVARITRRIQRTTRTVIPLNRVRAASETACGAVGKSITVSANVSIRVGAGGVPLYPQKIQDNFVAVFPH